MSELNMNGFFEAIKKERDAKQAKKILAESKQREDSWWNLYRKGLVKYDKNTVVI